MLIAEGFENYKLIATGGGEKLEEFDGITLLRPDPQVIWEPPFDLSSFKGLSGVYKRSDKGGGEWKLLKKIPEKFYVTWNKLRFECKLMGFKHTGLFPEQAANWARMIKAVKNAKREVNVLNLFAYTGGATVALASAGAKVCHVDAAKAMCETAKQNAVNNNIDITALRFIVDDCVKFCEREIRRGKKYDAILMDPPSYGRGPSGEMWKLEDRIFELVKLTKGLLSENPVFYLINSYTTGLQPTVMKNILEIVFSGLDKAIAADEVGILGEDKIVLPCGCSAFMTCR